MKTKGARASRAATKWIDGRTACHLLGTYYERLHQLAAEGHLRTRALPGSWTKYSLDDVMELAERSST
jgi:hypothetical protein